ncbi:hypothetical protein MRX96_000902 [Rhipicephalus microplus]
MRRAADRHLEFFERRLPLAPETRERTAAEDDRCLSLQERGLALQQMELDKGERIGQPTLVGLANRVFYTSQEQNYKHRIAWLVILRQRRIIKWTTRRRTCASVPTSADCFGSRGVDSDTAGRWARLHRLYKEATPYRHHSEWIGPPTLIGLTNRVFYTSQVGV